MTSATIVHLQRLDITSPQSKILNFPKSPLDLGSKLNKYLEHCYVLGDPHLGRRFTAGVPLHRRGDRERMQMQQFHAEVVALPKGRSLHITVGDLFDGWNVNNEAIHFAAETYRLACNRNPGVEFIVLAGNHDLSKDKTKVSAFHLFEEMVRDLPQVTVVMDNVECRTVDGLQFVFVPYHPFETSIEYLNRQQPRALSNGKPYVVFGHWDLETYGREESETLGLVPWELLDPELCEGVITGHDHNRKRVMHTNGIEVFITGSMQAYAHGQDDPLDPNPLYLTLTLDELQQALSTNPDVYSENCLKVILRDDQEPIADVNCYQLQFTRASMVKGEGAADLEVDVAEFDLRALFFAVMDEKGVSVPLTQTLWEKL